MSLFGSLMGDVEDDPFFGSHMRHMRQMNSMMNTLFSDPFGMLGENPLAMMGASRGNALMPFMPQMPSLNRLFSADLSDGHMSSGSSYSSRTVVMSSGMHGSPQVFSSTSSTKIGPNGVKETRKTLQDSRTGVKKMSIGHHIGERAHVVEREQNYYSGDAEERQEFINLEEEEAEDFDREFQVRAGQGRNRNQRALTHAPHSAPRLALPPPPAQTHVHPPAQTHVHPPAQTHVHPPAQTHAHVPTQAHAHANRRPHARRPLRAAAAGTLAPAPSNVREVYSGSHPRRHKHHRHRHETDNH